MKTSRFFKVYFYLNGKYFIKNKMIVRLLYTNDNIAVYKVIRNNKIVVTRLDDFVIAFNIINYR